jgi:hypothetical protein
MIFWIGAAKPTIGGPFRPRSNGSSAADDPLRRASMRAEGRTATSYFTSQ